MASGSKVSIYGAIIANVLIAISKFIAGVYTGSSAMFSEGIHSLVDTANGGLLLYGIKRSQKPADQSHPFGYGMEIYFWSFVVAVLIFALGGGIAIYEGIHHIIEPATVANIKVNYIVLGLAILFEGTSFVVALKQFSKEHGRGNLIQKMRKSKDSSGFAIIIEDFGALFGLVVALLGLFLGDVFGWAFADGLASVIIGLMLTGMAFFLAAETKALLIGESMDLDQLAQTKKILDAQESVHDYGVIRSVHFGPRGVMLGVDIHFLDSYSLEQIEDEIISIEQQIIDALPEVKHVFIEIKDHEHLNQSI